MLVRCGGDDHVPVQAAGPAALLRCVLRHRRADAGPTAAGSALAPAADAPSSSGDRADATGSPTEPCAPCTASASPSATWWLSGAAAWVAAAAAPPAAAAAFFVRKVARPAVGHRGVAAQLSHRVVPG